MCFFLLYFSNFYEFLAILQIKNFFLKYGDHTGKMYLTEVIAHKGLNYLIIKKKKCKPISGFNFNLQQSILFSVIVGTNIFSFLIEIKCICLFFSLFFSLFFLYIYFFFIIIAQQILLIVRVRQLTKKKKRKKSGKKRRRTGVKELTFPRIYVHVLTKCNALNNIN